MPARKADRITEHDVSVAVSQILANTLTGEAEVAELVRRVPDVLSLSTHDRQQSQTRPNEELWEQQVRNITSHHKAEGNFIREGYLERIPKGLRITSAGRRYINAKKH